jgi:hypothetical protein
MRTSVGIAALLLTVGLVGCGGNDNGSGVASANGSTSSPTSSATPGGGNDRDADLRFAQCMRENGVPKFPDPDANGGVGIDLNKLGVDKATVDAAQEKCKKYAPNGGELQQLDAEQLEQLRQMAQCMRENGFPDFPDPSDEGLQLNANEHPEWSPDNPRFKAAQEKCNDEAGLEGGESSSNQSGSEA